MTPNLLFEKLAEIITPSYKHQTPKMLQEDGVEATCREVKLVYNGKILTYKFDPAPHTNALLLPYFIQGQAHEMSDFLVICLKEDKLYVFICNLKSRNLSNTHSQVHAGYLFSTFLIQTAARCLGNAHSPDFVEYRAIHFINNPKFYKPLIRSKPKSYEMYSNKLRYTFRPCSEDCILDHLIKTPISE